MRLRIFCAFQAWQLFFLPNGVLLHLFNTHSGRLKLVACTADTVVAGAGATLHGRLQPAAERFAACAVRRASVLQLPVLPSNAAFGKYSGYPAFACGCRLTIVA